MTDDERKIIKEKVLSLPLDLQDVLKGLLTSINDFETALDIIDSYASETVQNEPIEGYKNHLERVAGQESANNELDIISLQNDINGIINNFCALHGIEDFTKAPQRQFTAVCIDIGNQVIKPSGILKDNTVFDNGSGVPTTCGRYDWERVAQVTLLYDYLCQVYNKAFLHDALADFLGMAINTLTDNADVLNRFGVDIYAKREETLAAGAADNNTRNITGVLACLNHWHNWTQTTKKEVEVKQTAVIYPEIGSLCQPKQITQTEQVR